MNYSSSVTKKKKVVLAAFNSMHLKNADLMTAEVDM